MQRRFLSLVLVLGLLFSFGLHAVQVAHVHGGEHVSHAGENEHESGVVVLDEYMHLSDKKVFMTLSEAVLVLWTVYGVQVCMRAMLLYLSSRTLNQAQKYFGTWYRVRNYLYCYFRKGILHSKAY